MSVSISYSEWCDYVALKRAAKRNTVILRRILAGLGVDIQGVEGKYHGGIPIDYMGTGTRESARQEEKSVREDFIEPCRMALVRTSKILERLEKE